MLWTRLFILLLLQAMSLARPRPHLTEKERLSSLSDAERQARLGDFSFLCRVLCESVEDSSDDSDCEWDYFFDGSVICEKICNSKGIVTTTMKPKRTKPPMKKTTPKTSKGTPTTTRPGNPVPVATTSMTPSMSPTTETQKPSSTPPVSSTVAASSVSTATTQSELPSSTLSSKATQTSTASMTFTSNQSTTPTISSNGNMSTTVVSSKSSASSSESTTALSTSSGVALSASTASSKAAKEETTTTKADAAGKALGEIKRDNIKEGKDLMESADVVTIAVKVTPTTEEISISEIVSSNDLEMETSQTAVSTMSSGSPISKINDNRTTPGNASKSARLEALRSRLLPHMPDLVDLWCQLRNVLPSDESAAAVAKLCANYTPSKTTAQSAIFDFFLTHASDNKLMKLPE